MEKNIEFLGDDCIYPSDFGEELFDVVSVKELLQAPQESNDFASCSTVRETYFHISDYKAEIEEDEEQREECEERERNASFTSLIGNTPNFVDEPTLPSFADLPIDFFPKYVHFTNASRSHDEMFTMWVCSNI